MKRREFLGAAAGLGLAATAARPNFLFLISDQIRADALAVSGNTFVRTPNLDGLARGGVRFSNAYCPQALCTPSRASLLSGVYPHTTGLDHNLYKVESALRMPEYRLTPNWPALLREAGYATGYIGKWHLGEADPGLFDYWNGYNSLKPHWMGKPYESQYRSDAETDDAMAFLEKNRSRPFALIVSYYPPHTPYQAPKKFQDLYAGKTLEHMEYYAAVSAVDWNIGRLLEKLNALSLEANTLVSFTADHGETFGKRLGSTNKTVSYEESAKVPLLVRWPARLPRGLVYEGGVSTIDLMPTILEAAALPLPARLQGRSRLGEMEKRQTGWKAPVFLQNITQKAVDGRPLIERAVRTEKWKLILRDRLRNELYNLEEDPGETNDLFPDPRWKAKGKELAGLILDWGRRLEDQVAVGLAKVVAAE
ncbi:MAG: sulfatase-like hydrolase/transferase [Acidobacteria bacterium]|nr:sulfatase-like hydrolase/transferase [Acidobacteriota bacterium]